MACGKQKRTENRIALVYWIVLASTDIYLCSRYNAGIVWPSLQMVVGGAAKMI